MFKDSSPSQCSHSYHSYFFFSSPITAASHFNFCSLALSAYFVSYVYSVGKSLFMGRLRIALIFFILTIACFISESLLGNTFVAMAISQKCPGFPKVLRTWGGPSKFDVVKSLFIVFSRNHFMEGCFTFQWRGGFRWGASFLSGGCAPWGEHRFWWGGFKKNYRMEGGAPPMPPTMENPGVWLPF